MPAHPDLTGASALLSVVTAIAGGAAYLAQSRKLREEHARVAAQDWRAVAEAHQARIDQLAADLKAIAARLEESEADREFLRSANLDLQRKLHKAMSRIRALEGTLRRQSLPVPGDD